MVLTELPFEFASKVLHKLAGPQRAGVVGPTELGAALMRQRAAVVASSLSEESRAKFLVRNVPFR